MPVSGTRSSPQTPVAHPVWAARFCVATDGLVMAIGSPLSVSLQLVTNLPAERAAWAWLSLASLSRAAAAEASSC